SLDHYQVLSVPHDASVQEIKAAYHRALLQHHPDKQNALRGSRSSSESIEISVIKRAYETLVSPEKRGEYDVFRRRKDRIGRAAGPRPAQVISLEEWISVGSGGNGDEEEEEEGPWRYPCRCSGFYEISVSMMERGVHLVGCSSCSEVVWAGYELQGMSSFKMACII
ncbi:DnaJ-domain-containing protein, partial [Coprinellus micaceus]